MFYVVTAVHNCYAITEAFVDRLLEQTMQDMTLVLVDDGSTDGTADMVKEKMPNTVILTGDGNLWWGGALHMAYKWLCDHAADDDIVMFANDDTQFQNDYLAIAEQFVRQYPDSLITGCGYDVHTGELIDGAAHWDFKKGAGVGGFKPTDVANCASTRSLFFTGKVLKKTGGFHPVLLPHYASDYEWTIRAARKGFPIRSFEQLRYTYDFETTGDYDLTKMTLKKVFSKRSMVNPIYRMIFVLMSTPIRYLPSHLWHQLRRYVKKSAAILAIIKRR